MNEKSQKIKQACLAACAADPLALAQSLMQEDGVAMHGPEHHMLGGAALLTALHCAGALPDLAAALDELAQRAEQMPGATCGLWGVCGSASSVGAALAIWHGTGPLSSNTYYKDNLELTSRALARIAQVGGPRCCKRNAFISLLTAAEFIAQKYRVTLPVHTPVCGFSPRNAQCLHANCPFFGG